MKYTAKQIRPKRYPNEKPSNSGLMWIFRNDGNWIDVGIYKFASNYIGFTWFIDVPGAPPELMPCAYPEYKPSEDGEYLVHDYNRDLWSVAVWDNDMYIPWRSNVDYFIPYRLEEENKMDVIWDTDDVFVKAISDEAVTAFAKDWLDLQGKREPEIAPCPNPECSNPLGVYIFEEADGSCYVTCDTCGYNSPYGDTESEAKRLHNLIAKKERAMMTQREYDLRKANPYDLNDVAKLTREEE